MFSRIVNANDKKVYKIIRFIKKKKVDKEDSFDFSNTPPIRTQHQNLKYSMKLRSTFKRYGSIPHGLLFFSKIKQSNTSTKFLSLTFF